MRMSHQEIVRLFQDHDRLFSRDRRKVVQELDQCVAGSQIIEQGANGNPRADEYRRAPENVGGRNG